MIWPAIIFLGVKRLFFHENVDNVESKGYFYQINKSTGCLNIYFSRDDTFFKNKFVLLKNDIIQRETPFYFAVPLF